MFSEKLSFPASLAARGNHVTQFWPMKWKQKMLRGGQRFLGYRKDLVLSYKDFRIQFCLSPISSMTGEGYLAQPLREKRKLGKLI